MAQNKKKFNSIKRAGIEHGFSIISIIVLALLFATITIFLLLFPRPTESQLEKRKLAEFPTFEIEDYFNGTFLNAYFSGDVTSEITNFYDDTVPYHDDFKNMGNNFRNIFGFPTEDGVKIIGKPVEVVSKPENPENSNKPNPNDNSKPVEQSGENSDDNQTSSQSSTPEESDARDYTSEEASGSEENGILVVKQDGHYRAMELFGGGSGKNYISALNKLHKDLGSSVKIYSMPIALASEYYLPLNYSQYSASQKDCFDNIASKLDEGIISVDADSIISKHTEEDIYCRTDHHWQPLGAYYAAQAFSASAGTTINDISTYTKFDNEGFVGTMYAFSKDANILNDPETFTYYKPSNIDKCKTYYYDTSFKYTGSGNFFNGVDVPNSYLVFMGGDEQVIKVKTNVNNGRKLCVVKDSYGNAEIPYYMEGFEEIYVVDMRYFELNLVDFVKEMGVTDLLFSMCSYSVVGENANNLENLRTQAKGKAIVDGALSQKDD